MRISNIPKALCLLPLLTLPFAASAMPMGYNFNLTFTNNYSVAGTFTAEDLNSDNYIRDAEVTQLDFSLLQGSTPLWSQSGPIDGSDNSNSNFSPFNFNYDIAQGTFLTAGASNGSSGQSWGACGSATQNGLRIGNNIGYAYVAGPGCVQAVASPQNFVSQTSNPTASVPLPGPLALLGVGLLAFVGSVRTNQRVKS